MDVRNINLDDWYQSGEGATAISYFNKNDDSIMLKLFTGSVTASNYAGVQGDSPLVPHRYHSLFILMIV